MVGNKGFSQKREEQYKRLRNTKGIQSIIHNQNHNYKEETTKQKEKIYPLVALPKSWEKR